VARGAPRPWSAPRDHPEIGFLGGAPARGVGGALLRFRGILGLAAEDLLGGDAPRAVRPAAADSASARLLKILDALASARARSASPRLASFSASLREVAAMRSSSSRSARCFSACAARRVASVDSRDFLASASSAAMRAAPAR